MYMNLHFLHHAKFVNYLIFIANIFYYIHKISYPLNKSLKEGGKTLSDYIHQISNSLKEI